jgi:hypothetical protein
LKIDVKTFDHERTIMNALTNPSNAESEHRYTESVSSGAEARLFKLKRTGRKSIRFDGWQLVEALGTVHGKQVWHEINLYRTDGDRIVVELIVRTNLADQNDIHRVNTFVDLIAAAKWLESYQPAEDAKVPNSLNVVETPLPWAMLQAVSLRQQIYSVDIEYRTMLTDIFIALDLADLADEVATTEVKPDDRSSTL